MNPLNASFLIVVSVLLLQGCASTYTTPAAGVSIPALTDDDIDVLMQVEPASPFPARVAVARIQASGYSSDTNYGYGSGAYSVLTTRDIEEEADFERLARLPMLTNVTPLNRILLPTELNSLKDLRRSAARLKTDLILVYSVDTAFHVEGTPLGPLSLISLGFIPNKKAYISSTTSGALIDVRTGYVYGVTEATEREQQSHTIWNSTDAIDKARVASEKASFQSFLTGFEELWKNTVEQYAATKTSRYSDQGEY